MQNELDIGKILYTVKISVPLLMFSFFKEKIEITSTKAKKIPTQFFSENTLWIFDFWVPIKNYVI